jgi:hypothetical protein
VVLVVGVVVDGGLAVSLTIEELRNDIEALLEVTFAVRRGMIRAGQTSRHRASVWLVVRPAAWPARGRRKVVTVRVPVETRILMSNITKAEAQ